MQCYKRKTNKRNARMKMSKNDCLKRNEMYINNTSRPFSKLLKKYIDAFS